MKKNRAKTARKGRQESREKKKTDVPLNFDIVYFGNPLTLYIYIFQSNLAEIYFKEDESFVQQP